MSNKDLTANQKLLIEAKYNKNLKKLTDDYVKYQSETEINTRIATLNTRLQQVKTGSKEEYQIQVDIAKENARLERENIENSIKNEELKAAKIKEVNAKLQKEINELASDFSSSQIQKNTEQELLAIEKMYESGLISKSEYEAEIVASGIKSLQSQIESRKKYGLSTIELEKELADKILEIRKELKGRSEDLTKELYQSARDTFTEFTEFINEKETSRLRNNIVTGKQIGRAHV